MVTQFNLVIIAIFLVYIINSYFLSVKQNIIKITSFLFRIILAWIVANSLASLVLNYKISTSNYEYVINGKIIYNMVDIVKVIILQNFPEISYIINERSASIYIIESISIMLIRTIILIISFIVITFIYRVSMYVIKKINNKKQKPIQEISRKRGLVFGFIQSFIIVFLISIPFSGISSLTNEVLRIENNQEISQELLLFKDYRNTLSGKVFNVLNINKKPIDVFMFDEVFSIEIDNKTIHLSEEVKVYVDIIEIIELRGLKNFDKSIVEKIDEDLITELLTKLKTAKSLNISAPLLIDYFLINYYQINVNDGFYDVDYYNECTVIGNLLVLYLNENNKLNYNDPLSIDPVVISKFLNNLSNLELLNKLSPDISKEIFNNKDVYNLLAKEELDLLNLNNVNYKKEISLLQDMFDIIFEIDSKFNKESIIELSKLLVSSNLLMDNNELFFEWIINNYLENYKDEISRLSINEDDIRSLIIISKAYVDNGFLEPFSRLSKLYDEETIGVLIDAIISSDLLINNLGSIFKLFLIQSKFEIDFRIMVPDKIDFKSEEGKKELRDLLRLFQIVNYGITQKNLEENLDEICNILKTSSVVKANINNFINWGIEKYNTSNYEIYVLDVDFDSPAGKDEIDSLIKILKLVVERKIIDSTLVEIINFSKEDLDVVLSSKILEEALIHLIYDLGKGEDIPIVVNFELDDPAWYKSERNAGELRNFIYAIKIIFKDIKNINDIKFTPELILSIDDGTIDTNKDGVVDGRDENELLEIMKSKIISDSIIKFIYDYYKDLNK